MSENAQDPGTEAELHERVKLAAESYDRAKVEAQSLIDVWNAGNFSDGTFAIFKATRILREATSRYAKALVEYSAFILTREADRLP